MKRIILSKVSNYSSWDCPCSSSFNFFDAVLPILKTTKLWSFRKSIQRLDLSENVQHDVSVVSKKARNRDWKMQTCKKKGI